VTHRADGLRTAVITVLGSGFAPVASGTAGALASVLLFAGVWAGARAVEAPRVALEVLIVAAVLGSSWLAVAWGPWAIERFASPDPKPFVLDEFAGQWIAVSMMPLALHAPWPEALAVIGGQFLLFRLFDILKPPPARQFESLPAGWGVLCDDLMAGVYANVVGQVLWRLTPLREWLASMWRDGTLSLAACIVC
jgi:phosphatidylglycerophosphatase A